MDVSVVIPVHDGAATVPELVRRLEPVLGAAGGRYEAVLVNDGSTDDSWNAITRLAGEHRWVRGIDLMRNYGQHNALLCGVRAARYEVIVTMDDDLQHPPEEIPRLLEALDETHDLVYGVPQEKQHGLWRTMASRCVKLGLSSAMRAEAARSVSAFRAFRARLTAAFTRYQDPFVFIDVLLAWGTSRIRAVKVRHEPRRAGRSGYGVRKLIVLGMTMLTSFSTLPLRLGSFVGFGLTLFGAAVLVYVVASHLVRGGSVPGFPFLASIIAIFSGAQLFALGIMGEYLARVHSRSMQRPVYVVREETGRHGNAA